MRHAECNLPAWQRRNKESAGALQLHLVLYTPLVWLTLRISTQITCNTGMIHRCSKMSCYSRTFIYISILMTSLLASARMAKIAYWYLFNCIAYQIIGPKPCFTIVKYLHTPPCSRGQCNQTTAYLVYSTIPYVVYCVYGM